MRGVNQAKQQVSCPRPNGVDRVGERESVIAIVYSSNGTKGTEAYCFNLGA